MVEQSGLGDNGGVPSLAGGDHYRYAVQPVAAEVDQWLSRFEQALSEGDSTAAAELFADDGFWRDLVSFTWNKDPRVSITVLAKEDWYHHVTLRGRAVLTDEDSEFDAIDRLSRHYTGQPYSQRDRGRVSAWIEVESWHAWAAGRPWTGSN